MPKCLTRELTSTDLTQVTEIHLRAFPDSALTKLGREAVRRYYEWLLTGPHDSECLGAFTSGEMSGFCFGGVFRGALSGFVNKNRAFLIRLVITHPWLLVNPIFRERLSLGLRVLRRYRPPQTSTPNTSSVRKKQSFGILSIAVHPQLQGGGAGRALMAESERIAVERGFSEMNLTVHPDNTQSIGFYERLGWIRVLEEEGWKGRMVKSLTP